VAEGRNAHPRRDSGDKRAQQHSTYHSATLRAVFISETFLTL
jgi:hypothetical protein